MSWQNFFATHGQWIAGVLAGFAAIVGIVASVASNQLAETSNAQLARAGLIIERLEKQVSIVIGDEWPALTNDQIEKLREELIALPIKGRAQIMYLNAFGKAFAQSIATAFRAAQWDVMFSSGSGFEAGVEVGPGANGKTVISAMEKVIQPSHLIALRPNETFRFPETFIMIGVGSRPPQN